MKRSAGIERDPLSFGMGSHFRRITQFVDRGQIIAPIPSRLCCYIFKNTSLTQLLLANGGWHSEKKSDPEVTQRQLFAGFGFLVFGVLTCGIREYQEKVPQRCAGWGSTGQFRKTCRGLSRGE